MNITKYYPRIVNALYETPWMILPSAHETLRRAFEAHLANGQIELPMELPTVEDDDTEEALTIKPNIAVITVEGVIGKRLGMIEQCMGGVDVDNISAAIDEVMEDPEIETVLFEFHTPGGSVQGIPELADKIAELSEHKQTIAYTDTLCASAGYYLASQCNAIYASPSAELGSVGVYSIYLDETRALDKEGITVNAISAGKYKLTGFSGKVMTDEERTMLQADVDNIYEDFKIAVTSNRAIADEDMQGQVFSGNDVINKNFVDGHINSLKELLLFLTTPLMV